MMNIGNEHMKECVVASHESGLEVHELYMVHHGRKTTAVVHDAVVLCSTRMHSEGRRGNNSANNASLQECLH